MFSEMDYFRSVEFLQGIENLSWELKVFPGKR